MLQIVDRYTYLGFVIQENINLNIMVSAVAKSAGRALGLVIANCKTAGGFPFDVFTHLYDSMV